MKSPKMVLSSLALFMSVASFSQTGTTNADTSTTKKDNVTKRDTTSYSNHNSSGVSSGTSTQNSSSGTTAPSASGSTQSGTGVTSGAGQNSSSASGTTNGNTQNSGSSASGMTGTNSTTTAGTTQSDATGATAMVPKPNFGRYYIPVLGSYESAQESAQTKSVTITPDETNAGKVWVEGLTPTRFFALLKTAPGTYKIPAQKQEQGSVSEGTIVYDESTKQINICLGCGYQDNASASAMSTDVQDSKTTAGKKAKSSKAIISFSGTKKDQGTATINQ